MRDPVFRPEPLPPPPPGCDIVSIGEQYLDALQDAQDARKALRYYDHNADPCGDIQKRLAEEYASALHKLRCATAVLIHPRFG